MFHSFCHSLPCPSWTGNTVRNRPILKPKRVIREKLRDVLQERKGTSLNYFKVFFIYIEQFSRSIFVYLGLSRISVYFGLSWSIFVHLGLSRTISDYLGLSWSISVHLGLSQSISDCLGPSGIIWDYSGLYGTIWHYLALSGTIWYYLTLSGTIWD